MRKEFERRDGVDIIYHPLRHAHKKIREGITYKDSMTNKSKVLKLVSEYSDILSELRYTERKKEDQDWEATATDAPQWFKRSRWQKSELLVYHSEAVRIVSRFEAMLDADAVQQRPLLNSQERTTVKDVLKEDLEMRKWARRVALALVLAMVYLMCWGSYRFMVWHARRFPEKEREISESHTWDEHVE